MAVAEGSDVARELAGAACWTTGGARSMGRVSGRFGGSSSKDSIIGSLLLGAERTGR